MAVPAAIAAELAALQAQIAAANPLQSAPRATVTAIRLNMEALLSDIETAQGVAAGGLDSWTAPADPGRIAAGVLAAVAAATSQMQLTDMLALAGRASLNLNQIAV